MRLQPARAPLRHVIEKSFVDKETFPLARAARAALVTNIPHAVNAKAALIEVFTQGFESNGLAALSFISIIKLDIDDGEGISIAALIEKGELPAAELGIHPLQLPQIETIVQLIFEQPKIGVALPLGQLVPDSNAIFPLRLIYIRRLDG